MVDVFISYARTERERAEEIKSAIEGLGLTIFFDVDGLDGGDVFPDVLDREVKSAGCVLGIWSPHALSRPWIKTECLIGKDRRVLIPVLVEPVNSLDVPAAFYGVQSIDLTDFSGDLTHPGWIKLVRALARTLRRPELITVLKPKHVQGGAPARPVKRYARWIAVAASLSALAAVLFGWDANGRTKIAYCANVEEHWGVPSCVGRLDSQTFKKRSVSYRISVRGERVVELARVNSRDVLRGASFDYLGEDWADGAAQWQFSYRDDGKIASVVASDEYGRAVRKLDYDFEPDMGGAVVRSGLGAGRSEMFSARAAALGESVEVKEGVPSLASNSSVGQHRLTFDASGRVVRRMFEALGGGSTLVDAEGVAGRAYAYSPAGLPNEIRNLSLDGKPDALAGRVTIISSTYTDRGDLAGVEWRASNGHLVPGPSGSARVSIKRDAAGNGLEEQFYDANGAPVFDLVDGYARAIYLYGDRGDRLEETYYGLDDKITHKTTGSRAAIERVTYDAKGRQVSRAFFDVNGKPFLSRDEFDRGAAVIQLSLNTVGWIVSFSFFGADGKPVLAGENCSASERFKTDEQGRVIERSYWGTDGRPLASCKTGVASERYQWDNFGRLVKIRNFGLNGKPIISSDVAHGFDIVYDERGNRSEIIRVGLDGRPLNNVDGAVIGLSYDSRGRVVVFEFFDAQRRPQMSSNRVSLVQLKYDERGNMIQKAFFGVKGEPIANKESAEGAHSQELEYDSRGAVLSQINRDVDNTVLGPILKFDADEQGRHIKVSCWTPKDQPADCTGELLGAHAMQLELDERGNRVKAAILGTDGQPAMSFGFAVARSEYSLVGDLVRRANFDLGDRPAVDEKSGCSITTFDYDDRGNKVKESCFSTNGRPALDSSLGAAEFTYEYDARNRKIGEFTFGVDGKPLVTSKGYAGRRMAYDVFGAKTEERYFGADGQPVAVLGEEYAAIRYGYDSFGYLSENRYIGLDGKLSARGGKEAIVRWSHDIRGNATEVRYYDRKEELFKFIRYSFDANSRLEKTEFFGANSKLDWWETYQYSKSGVCISRRGFKAGGKSLGELNVQDQSECL